MEFEQIVDNGIILKELHTSDHAVSFKFGTKIA